jgi:hypothetical protein
MSESDLLNEIEQLREENHKLKVRLLKQQPAQEHPTIENTEVCPCGFIFVDADDYDTLGSESGVICPNCGNEKFQTIKDLLKQQPPAGEFTRVTRKHLDSIKEEMPLPVRVNIAETTLRKACDRLDTSEAIKDELVKACEAYIRHQELHDSSDHPKANMFCTECPRYRKQIEAVITKGKG